MHLDEIRRLIAASEPFEWNVIHPPTYLGQQGLWTSGGRPGEEDFRWGLEVREHYYRAAYRPNVNLGLAWGMPERFDDDRDGKWTPEWAARFPDGHVTAEFVDILWCGMLVDRSLVLNVDGGRGVLPAPSAWTVRNDEKPFGFEHVGETVHPWQVELARVVHRMLYPFDAFERYFEASGFVVVSDEENPQKPNTSRDW